jgi:hypothetical protein
MAAFLLASALFMLALGLHFIWWRWRLPRHHTLALLGVFAAVPLAVVLICAATGLPPFLTWADLPGIALFYGAACGCYLITYAGVEETSPSLVIIRALERAGPAGCTHADLGACVTEDRFITPRINALQRDGLVSPSGAGARLTPAGLRVARLAMALARLFNLDEGS